MSEQIVDVLSHLALVTKGQEIDQRKFVAYALELGDIPFDELVLVCRDLGRNGDGWFPSLRAIRKRWEELRGPMPFDFDAYEARRIRFSSELNRPALKAVNS